MSRRYPLAPLLEAAGLTESGLTRRAGLSGSTLKRAREMGLAAEAADRYAVRCGLHPAQVWPDFGMEPCAECDELFAPARKGHVYCSRRCNDRAKGRRYARKRWAEDDAHREARRAYMAEYRAAAPKAWAIYRQRWADANPERVREIRREAMRRYRARSAA